MFPRLLLLMAACGATITLHIPGSDGVLCFRTINDVTGECETYLGDGVSQEDCCLNENYGFRTDRLSVCQPCGNVKWSLWSEWSPCTVSCHEGIQQRKRIRIGEGDIAGHSVEVRACSLQDCCPGVGGWSEWTAWSQCSATCQTGQEERTRECNNPEPACHGKCIGASKETRICDIPQSCPTHGAWGNWEPWRECPSSCINEGSGVVPVQSRSRLCNNPSPSGGEPPGRPCEGNEQDLRDCSSLPFCPVDGQWGVWKISSGCSVTCGIGQVTEKRPCNNPAPRHGGKDCVGSPTQHHMCNTRVPCPIDGQWMEWQPWRPCSLIREEIRCKKKDGLQSRIRICQQPKHNGSHCGDDYRESRRCYNLEGCRLKGLWSEWSEWGLCSSPCGYSERKRYKECLPVYPDYPTIVQGLTMSAEAFFSGTPIVKCTPIDGETLKVEEKTDCKNVPQCT